ncbi:MAG: carboxymuconolactone decarboxylase family protein [Candidatus Eisenbacteria bacterium]|nr:carboxymuconolactone decarboxylase family protein [Candidatus Eisenbacteria bacterium]
MEETLLQLVLFSGYPTAIEAFRVWRQSGPQGSPPGPGRPSGGTRTSWKRAGGKLCARIYGPTYAGLRNFMRRLSPELDALMTEVGYGRVLSRPGLPPAAREVVTVGALLGSDRPRQLLAHARGSLRMGIECEELDELLARLGPRLTRGQRSRARGVLRDARRLDRDGGTG